MADGRATLVLEALCDELIVLKVENVDAGSLRLQVVDAWLFVAVVVVGEPCVDVGSLPDTYLARTSFQSYQISLDGRSLIHVIVNCGGAGLFIFHPLVNFLTQELLVPHQHFQTECVELDSLSQSFFDF